MSNLWIIKHGDVVLLRAHNLKQTGLFDEVYTNLSAAEIREAIERGGAYLSGNDNHVSTLSRHTDNWEMDLNLTGGPRMIPWRHLAITGVFYDVVALHLRCLAPNGNDEGGPFNIPCEGQRRKLYISWDEAEGQLMITGNSEVPNNWGAFYLTGAPPVVTHDWDDYYLMGDIKEHIQRATEYGFKRPVLRGVISQTGRLRERADIEPRRLQMLQAACQEDLEAFFKRAVTIPVSTRRKSRFDGLSADEVGDLAGWSDDTRLNVLHQFLESRSLVEAYAAYARQVAEEDEEA